MTQYMRVKICGITCETDAVQAAMFGADAIGINFYPPSPRYVPPDAAERILRQLPPFVEPVGLFVNTPLAQMLDMARRLGRLRTLQSYGEPRDPSDPFPYQLLPSFNVRDESSLREIEEYVHRCQEHGHSLAAILADAAVPGQYGGTGHVAPWRLLADFHPGVPLILAGGLTPENVAEAIQLVRPYAVDVASGVESAPGRKDAEKVRRFVENAREAALRLA